MTDRTMVKPIRGRQLSKRDLYDEDFFKTYFAKQAIESRLVFLLKYVHSLEELHVKAKELNLTIELKQKNVMFTLEEDGKKISLSHKKISDKKLYDVQFFNRYFEDREVRDIQALENLQEDFQTFREEQHKEKVSAEEIEEAFKKYKEKRDAIHEFEIELTDNQIEKLVDDGVYIQVSFGIKQSGLIFIPNYQLDIFEEDNHKKYKVYIRETSSYFVYNKENMDNNCFIKGRTLIRQLSNDSQKLPYRRLTLKSLQEKISEINLMIELSNTNKQYQEIKDELVLEIAEIDMQLEETQEKIATLNKMAEVLINLKSEDHETRKLAKYDFAQMNMTESIMLDRLNTDILKLQQELGNEYEEIARRLDSFVKIINTNKFTVLKFRENALLE